MELKFYPISSLVSRVTTKAILTLVVLLFTTVHALFAQTPATALSFSGTSGSGSTVTVPSSPTLNISKNITIETWVYPTKNAFSVQDVVSKSTTSVNNGYIFPRFTANLASLQFYLRFDFSNDWTILTVPFGSNKLNTWHHVAATYDGYFMTIYIDGSVAGTLAYSGDISVNNNPLTIGNQPSANEYFGGKLDELRIWNRALTGCEINNNLTCELSGPQNGLALYYKFNQGLVNLPNPLVTTVTDASGNGNDGTLNAFLLTGLTSNWASGNVSGTCTVWNPVNATASAVKTIVPRGEDINLVSTGPSGATFSWTGPNGYTSTAQNPTITSPGTNASGTYTVTVTKGGCSASASVNVTVANRATALNFSNSSNVVSIPNSPSLNPTKISIETWINPSSNLPAVQDVICKSSKYNRVGYIFPRTQDGWQSFSFMLYINGQWNILSAQYGNLNQWNHVAATYDGFYMKIYLNGQLKGTLPVTGTMQPSSNQLLIGQQDGEPENFVGSIDETRIWGRALSQCEIQNNMNCQLYGDNNALASQVSLAAYFRYNQGLVGVTNSTETILADSSGNGNNGSLQNFVLNGTTSTWVTGNVTSTCTPTNPIVALASSNGPNVEVGSTLQLFASPDNATSYSWTGPGNYTSNQQNPIFTNATANLSGNYTVTVTGNGCISTSTTKVTVAYKAGSLNFDGVNDNVIVPANPSIQISKEITLESWVYPTNGTQNVQDVMGNSTQTANSGYIFPRTDDGWQNITFYLHINGVFEKLNAPYPGLNQWHHCAATYDGFYMRIYIDGVLVASKEIVGTITTNTNDLYLGFQPGFGEYFTGQVDETRLWSRALSQCEIINNMNCQLTSLQSNSLVAYFQYNQGFVGADNTGITTLIDASGNNNNGTLNNFALNGTSSNWDVFKVNTTCSTYSEPPVVAASSANVYGIGSTIQLFSSGGTNYSWTGPNSFVSTNQNPTIQNAQIANTGVYTVTVPFVKCSITKSTRLTVSSLDPITADGPTTFCPSSSVNLSTNAQGTYQWFLNNVAIAGATARTYSATQSGDYSVQVTNAGIVQYTAPITITVVDNRAPVPVVASLPVVNLLSPVTLTTIPTAIDNCSGTIQGVSDRSLLFNTPGTYTITWTYDDRNGNVSTQTQQVVVTPGQDLIPPVLTLPANQILAANTSVCGAIATFTATATDNSGLPVTITYSAASGSVFAVGVNTVTVTATDAANNVTTGSFTITVTPTIVAPIQGTTTICQNSTTQLSSSTAGGTWSSANTAIATVSANGLVTGVAAGTVQISYKDACGAAATTTITVKATPTAPTVSVTDNCGNSVLTASNYTGSLLWNTGGTTASITVTGGGSYSVSQTVNGCTSVAGSATAAPKAIPTAPSVSVTDNCGNSVLTASNYTGSLLWNTGAATASITVTTGGSYSVTQTVNGCTSAARTVTAAPKAVPTAPAVSVTDNCGNSVLTASNYTGSLLWNTGATTSSITVTTGGSYSVTQTVNGCTSVAGSVTAAPKAIPTAPTVAVANNCGSSVVTASNYTGSLLWNTGATTSSITVTTGASYSVTQTVNGCTSTAASIAAAPKAIPAAPTVSVTDNCGNSVVTASNYTGSLLWNTGATTSSITVTTGGSYSVTQTVNGCTSTAGSATASPKAAPTAPTVTVVNNCGNSVLTAANYTGSLLWNTGATTASITVTSGGSYSVTQTVNGCASNAATVTAAPKAGQTTPVITVVNNCGNSVLTAANYTGSLLWSNGATTSSITVTTAGNYSVTATTVDGCSATSAVTAVTITNGSSTPATITVSGADAFCNKTILTASSSVPNATFKWMYGNTVVATGSQLNLGLGNADGVYQVVASNGGCNSQPANYNYQKQNLISSYTILANSDVDLGDNNIVASGSVGVIDAKGDVSFGANSSVASPGSFVKSRSITIKKSYWWWNNVNIANPIYSPATGITLPQMYYNTANPKAYGNGQVNQYTTNVTLTGNYNNLIIKKGAVVTLKGTIFGNLKIEQGAQVTFTAATINIDQLQISKGPRTGYTYVRFTQDAKVLVSSSVTISSQCYINPDNQNVTFYLGDNKSDKEKFTVTGGDTWVNANIYIPNGDLKVTGGYRYGDYGNGWGDCDRDDDDDKYYGQGDNYVHMTGLFLVDELEGYGKNVIWNSFDCSASGVQVLPVTTATAPITTAQNSSATSETTTKQSEEELKVTVLPNPSTTYFTLKLESKYETPVNLRVMDAAGRVVDARSKLGSNSTVQIGSSYNVGTYFAELIQGNQRKVVQLIKVK